MQKVFTDNGYTNDKDVTDRLKGFISSIKHRYTEVIIRNTTEQKKEILLGIDRIGWLLRLLNFLDKYKITQVSLEILIEADVGRAIIDRIDGFYSKEFTGFMGKAGSYLDEYIKKYTEYGIITYDKMEIGIKSGLASKQWERKYKQQLSGAEEIPKMLFELVESNTSGNLLITHLIDVYDFDRIMEYADSNIVKQNIGLIGGIKYTYLLRKYCMKQHWREYKE